ncbi:hypothetical protein GIB67_021554 [Kingdonia uniflora]|uniref:Major facilitator superfamily (MFS) profile domain-containing protein n=1 Tax=Kingdonia uniflora TaxID=39325 RepID=A0A7J7L9Y3_9MAGN|nr:hypothetical protein GIB67_021554 [Kingdonia uniflora]
MPESWEWFIIAVSNLSGKEDIKFNIIVSLILSKDNRRKICEPSSSSNCSMLNVEERGRSYRKGPKYGRGRSQLRGKSKPSGTYWTCGKKGHIRRHCPSSLSKKIDEDKYTMNLTEEVSSDEALLLSCDDINESSIVDSCACFHATANEPWNMESGNMKGTSKEFWHGQTAHNMSYSSLRKKYDLSLISKVKIGLLRQFLTNLQEETIVSVAVAGAIVGTAIGSWMNDSWGRSISILIADVLFAIGAIVMGITPSPSFIILGRVFVGLGIGMASMKTPLYISEASLGKIRGALVSLNGLLITGGQFITYLVNLAFAHTSRTWRWMVGVVAVPAVIQFILMMFLPKSPCWLYQKYVFLTSFLFYQDWKEEAATILKKLYPPHEVEAEVEALRLSVEAEIAEEGSIGAGNIFTKIKNAWSNTIVRRGLAAGIGCQVAQQFVGINTVMYYSPTIVQLVGYASNSVSLALSLITSGLNTFGSIVSMLFVDRYGRKKLLLLKPDACLAFGSKKTCQTEAQEWYSRGCQSNVGHLAVLLLGLYILAYSPGMGTVPWIVKSMIYLLRHRGICGGMTVIANWVSNLIVNQTFLSLNEALWSVYTFMLLGFISSGAAIANWVSNLIVSQTFLSLNEALGSGYTFMLFGFISSGALVYLYMFVPETKGLAFEELKRSLRGPGKLGRIIQMMKIQHMVKQSPKSLV